MESKTADANPSNTDRIEKTTLIKAPIARVWRALTSAREFGEWFRVKLENEFAPGGRTTGHITYPGYEHLRFSVAVEIMLEPEYFSFRWHPYAIDPDADYSSEQPTLVEFRLSEEAGGTRLIVTESGFEQLPPGRRDEAFRMNSNGWQIQLQNIEAYLNG